MKILLVPIPLFNPEMGVDYYCFRYQKNGNMFLSLQATQLDDALQPAMFDVINQVGLEALTTGKPLFVPISHVTLLAGLENKCWVDPGHLVFILDKETPVEPVFMDEIMRLKELGYRFAASSKMSVQEHLPLIQLCDFIFVSIKMTNPKKARDYFIMNQIHVTIIPSDIQTAAEFERVKNDNFTLFEGPFYRLPMSKGQNTVSPLKINYINLLNIVRDENFEIEKVAKTVQRDAALSISLLRIVNSLGLREKVESIEYAAALIGQSELRKWITATVSEMIAADKPNEIAKLSLTRARFAENLARYFELGAEIQGLFLMGLFSVLDIILDMPMEKALNVVRVSDPIRDALLHKKGHLYPVLELILWYETADWVNASRSLIIHKMEPSDIYDAYLEALKWYNMLIAPETEEEEAAAETTDKS